MQSNVVTVNGNVLKIIDLLKSNNNITSESSVVSTVCEGSKIKKLIRSKLPNKTEIKLLLGTSDINVIYDIEFTENIIAIVCKNPKVLNSFFKFKEEVIIEQIDDENVKIERKYFVENFGQKYLSSSYSEYTKVYNDNSMAFYLSLAELSLN